MSKMSFIVLKDAEGNYYLLPREGVMQVRVPDEYKDELEQAIRSASGELSESDLEAVAGGTLSVGEFTASSGLTSYSYIRGQWTSTSQLPTKSG